MSAATERAAQVLVECLAAEHGVDITAEEARIVVDRMEDVGCIIISESGRR